MRGPNVRSLDSRHLAWPHLLRDPDPATATADCSTRWSYRQWGFQGQGHWADEQLQLARCQCRQQPRPIAAGPHEPSGAFASVRRTTAADSESPRICMFFPFTLRLSFYISGICEPVCGPICSTALPPRNSLLAISIYLTRLILTRTSWRIKCNFPYKIVMTGPETLFAMLTPKSPVLVRY